MPIFLPARSAVDMRLTCSPTRRRPNSSSSAGGMALSAAAAAPGAGAAAVPAGRARLRACTWSAALSWFRRIFIRSPPGSCRTTRSAFSSTNEASRVLPLALVQVRFSSAVATGSQRHSQTIPHHFMPSDYVRLNIPRRERIAWLSG